MQWEQGDQQGKCSPKHRPFTLRFSLHLFSGFQPSPHRQNDYILMEMATYVHQLNPGARASYATTAKKQIHFFSSREVLLTPAAEASTICQLLYCIVFFSHSHCCWSRWQRTLQQAENDYKLSLSSSTTEAATLNLTGKAKHAINVRPN